MLAHRLTCIVGLTRTNRAINTSMQFERFIEVMRAIDGVASALVQDCRNHFDEGGQGWITACGRNCSMKTDIVNKKLLGIVKCRNHLCDFVRHHGEMLRCRAIGSQSSCTNLKDGSSFKHIVEAKPVKLGE